MLESLLSGPDSSKIPHTVIRVTFLCAKETWAVDTTGCQYDSEKECWIAGEPTTYNATYFPS